ncbi:MAG: malonyl-CoA decarboxylase family protein [Candidatus Dormiibacterota bacterium]
MSPPPSWLEHVTAVAERGRAMLGRAAGNANSTANLAAICSLLIARHGEASGLALATDVVRALERMNDSASAEFLEVLAGEFSPPPEAVAAAVDRWRSDPTDEAVMALAIATEAPRQELFRRLNLVGGGAAALVKLRGQLLVLLPTRPHLRPVDADLRHLFSSWFSGGFLRLEQISWGTPAATLERLIAYEAVHEIHGWDDLRLRLAADRRCFAFFHPLLPGEPLIFVEIALTRELPTAIAPLLAAQRTIADARTAHTAVFFSISDCQPGLRGISFGNFLIKQVVRELSIELPGLRTYTTLSPVPGLARAVDDRRDPDAFTDERLRALTLPHHDEVCRLASTDDDLQALSRLLQRPGPYAPVVARIAGRLALAYLIHVKSGMRVADSVGHFHLSNGARLERINTGGDLSPRGRQSFGVMVNYVYEPQRLEVNHERYVRTGHVATGTSLSGEVKAVDAAWSNTPRRDRRSVRAAR